MPLSLEERERLAYIQGGVETAALLWAAASANNSRAEDLEWELRVLDAEVERLEKVIEEGS